MRDAQQQPAPAAEAVEKMRRRLLDMAGAARFSGMMAVAAEFESAAEFVLTQSAALSAKDAEIATLTADAEADDHEMRALNAACERLIKERDAATREAEAMRARAEKAERTITRMLWIKSLFELEGGASDTLDDLFSALRDHEKQALSPGQPGERA